jgi:hypothetical protein
MKTASLFAAALLSISTLPVWSQQSDASVTQSTTASTSGAPANPTVIAGAGGTADIGRHTAQSKPEVLQPVFAQLMGSLDSKSVKLGDPVELRTQSQMKAADGTAIPKGTKIMGRVTAVSAHSKDSQNAQLAVQFDRVVLKGGQSLAIRSEIQWVAPAPSTSMADMLRSQSDIGGGVMGDATKVAGGNNGGGLGNGGAGGYSQVNGHFVTTDSLTMRPGSVTNYGMQAPQTNGQAPAGGVKSTDASAMAGGAEPPHATGVPGVMLAGDSAGKISGTFSATRQNVHLDGGTRVVLGVAAVE